jgi:hypothetical protein
VTKVRAAVVVPGRIIEAEELWYDQYRWAAWIDGFGHVLSLDAEWPNEGARLVWESPPRGRGRVQEVVKAYEVRTGQTVAVEDAQLTGTQTVTFEVAGSDDVKVTLELDYKLKHLTLFKAASDFFLIRHDMTASLKRTLDRFSHERSAEITGS